MATLTAPRPQLDGSQNLPTAFVFPGQGALRKGMGVDVLARFPELCGLADSILGYSVRELCLSNPDDRLRLTEYLQPATYVVNALSYMSLHQQTPDFLAGHSLGEYNALLAAGCFDFEAGLRLVQRRAELMGRAVGGGMVAVIGLAAGQVKDVLARHAMSDIDIANYNAERQVVLSGPRTTLPPAVEALKRGGARCVPLNVSAAFHSRYMDDAAEAFRECLQSFAFNEPRMPVISNVTAEPYSKGLVADLLLQQINRPVRWAESMLYLRRQGVKRIGEVGSSRILSDLWETICEQAPETPAATCSRPELANFHPQALGSTAFREDYGIRHAYLAGSMFRGIASVALVTRMARNGLMGFFGTGGLSLPQVDEALYAIRHELGPGARYGANLLHQIDDRGLEQSTVELFLRHDVGCVEAAAYTEISSPLVRYRFSGAYRDALGRPRARRHIVAKVSRPAIALAFMLPPPEPIVRQLVAQKALTPIEAEIAGCMPVSQDICVESDSAGHTDGGVALTLVPTMTRLRDEVMQLHGYPDRIRIGASGGLGTPEAIAAAFVLGADFVVTGSINQCSPEAGTSEVVKDLLANLDVHDTTYAPAGDMFELGAKAQVVRKGTLFAARANKLHQLYRQYDSLEAIDAQTRQTIEKTYFRRSFEDVWQETEHHYRQAGRVDVLRTAECNPKYRMALLFKWYCAHSIEIALAGNLAERANFQIHCGPAMGAFNRFVRGTDLDHWQNRHVDVIADRLMQGAAALVQGHAKSRESVMGAPPVVAPADISSDQPTGARQLVGSGID